MVSTDNLINADTAYDFVAELFGVSPKAAIVILSIVSIWALVWKGIALWKSSRKGSKIWFIVLLIVNTLGILEILYIYLFSKIKVKDGKKSSSKQKKK